MKIFMMLVKKVKDLTTIPQEKDVILLEAMRPMIKTNLILILMKVSSLDNKY